MVGQGSSTGQHDAVGYQNTADRLCPDRGIGGFDFVVMGDMPYNTKEINRDQHFERLIAAINKLQPAFSIHVGDIKSGSTLCDDATLEKIKAYFMTFQQPLVYTPGDNEWTDCHRKSNGPFDPIERLAKIRNMFFPKAASWGQQTLAVTRQSDVSAFTHMVENARWTTQNILFVTVHVVGSNNNLRQNREATLEFLERNQANVAWINEAFAVAKRDGVQGIVLAMQANPDWRARHGDGNGFQDTVEALATNAAEFGKPLLIVHGDTHTFGIDQPLRHPKDNKKILTTSCGWKSSAMNISMRCVYWSTRRIPCRSLFSRCLSLKTWSSCSAKCCTRLIAPPGAKRGVRSMTGGAERPHALSGSRA